jgi:hypothetical protein
VTDTSKAQSKANVNSAQTQQTPTKLMPKTSAHITKLVSLACIMVAGCLLLMSSGCGSSSSSHTLSAAQAQAVSQEFSTALQAALSSAFSSAASRPRDLHPSLAVTLGNAHPEQSSDCTSSDSGESCNIPVSYSGSCPGGGTIAVAGDLDFTLNDSGNGSGSSTITITPTGCTVSNETINGNPSVTASTSITVEDDAPVFPITLNETGGISFSPNPTGSCTFNVQYTVSSASSCTVSGTVCGQAVSGSC